RARLVDSQKGLHGGFRSALLPEQVRIYDVLRAIDALPADMDQKCSCGAEESRELKCLFARFDKIHALYESFLKETTLADLMADEIEVKPALVQTKPEKPAGKKQRTGFEREALQVLSI